MLLTCPSKRCQDIFFKQSKFLIILTSRRENGQQMGVNEMGCKPAFDLSQPSPVGHPTSGNLLPDKGCMPALLAPLFSAQGALCIPFNRQKSEVHAISPDQGVFVTTAGPS